MTLIAPVAPSHDPDAHDKMVDNAGMMRCGAVAISCAVVAAARLRGCGSPAWH